MRRIIASLDIGDYTIKLVVGEMVHKKLNILACVDTLSRGIKNGFIVNAESALLALEEVFKRCEEQIGFKIDKVIVSVPSNNLECFISEGYTSVVSEDGIIKHDDIMNGIKSALYKRVNESREIVAVFPTKFLVDDVVVKEMPIGKRAQKLKLKVVVATVPKKNVMMITKCLEKIGVQVSLATVGVIGNYYEFKTLENDNAVGAVVDIGSSKTDVAIFNKGVITAAEVIDIGGEIIDYDLGLSYKINRGDAVYLKEAISLANSSLAKASESVILENKNGDKIKINQFDISEIVSNRLEEILNLAKKQINLLTKKEISYIIVTGGVTETAEFKYMLDYVFKNARVGDVKEIGARNNKYATSVGLIKYFDSKLDLENKDYSLLSEEDEENFGGLHKKINISEDSILGKLFGYFFDN